MVDPITGAALVGVGGWFADKVLGPSADALGQHLRDHVNHRIGRIFGRAQATVQDANSLKPLPIGFVSVFVQKASFGEDSERLTDMWAQLLLSASANLTSRHTAFADILSQLGHPDALMLDRLSAKNLPVTAERVSRPVNYKEFIRQELRQAAGETPKDEAEAAEQLKRLWNTDLRWPGELTSAQCPYLVDVERGKTEQYGMGGGGNPLSYDMLARQRLLESFSFDLSQSFASPSVEGVLMTTLGVEFMLVCRGIQKHSFDETALDHRL